MSVSVSVLCELMPTNEPKPWTLMWPSSKFFLTKSSQLLHAQTDNDSFWMVLLFTSTAFHIIHFHFLLFSESVYYGDNDIECSCLVLHVPHSPLSFLPSSTYKQVAWTFFFMIVFKVLSDSKLFNYFYNHKRTTATSIMFFSPPFNSTHITSIHFFFLWLFATSITEQIRMLKAANNPVKVVHRKLVRNRVWMTDSVGTYLRGMTKAGWACNMVKR